MTDDVIVKFNAQGQLVARLAPFPGERGQTGNDLAALAVAPDGSLWVATRKLHKPIIHLDSAGKALPVPDFELVLPGTNDTVDDIDLVGGRLYASGYLGEQKAPIGLVVVSPDGLVQDSIAGRAHYVAVGPHVYLSAHELPARRASHGGGTTSGYVPVPTVPRADHVRVCRLPWPRRRRYHFRRPCAASHSGPERPRLPSQLRAVRKPVAE